MVQQLWRTSIRTGRVFDVMAVENQPAVAGDGFVERTIDALAVDMLFGQGHRAQELQIHGTAVDAGQNAAGGTEYLPQLPLARHRCDAKRIGEILDSDRR